jgi:hypothetical protein
VMQARAVLAHRLEHKVPAHRATGQRRGGHAAKHMQ